MTWGCLNLPFSRVNTHYTCGPWIFLKSISITKDKVTKGHCCTTLKKTAQEHKNVYTHFSKSPIKGMSLYIVMGKYSLAYKVGFTYTTVPTKHTRICRNLWGSYKRVTTNQRTTNSRVMTYGSKCLNWLDYPNFYPCHPPLHLKPLVHWKVSGFLITVFPVPLLGNPKCELTKCWKDK